jgi:hypothetical protein
LERTLPLKLFGCALLCGTCKGVILIPFTSSLLFGGYIQTKLFARTAGLFDKLTGGALSVLLLPPTLPNYTSTC